MRAVDLFCGAGGSSLGARAAGAEIVAGVDLDPIAIATFGDNFPKASLWPFASESIDLDAFAAAVGSIDLLLASPECTNHTHARGSKERNEASRMTAFEVMRFARRLKPRWIVIENVVNMRPWDRYKDFIRELRQEYFVSEVTLTASDFGVPQARRRLFVLCDSLRPPEKPSALPGPVRTARMVLAEEGLYATNPLVSPRRAQKTLERADRGLAALGPGKDFLMVYYGTDRAGGWQRLDVPLRTVTTVDRFALVSERNGELHMRMLQVPELQRAMGFPPHFALNWGNRREKIRLLGNAVCPPVMSAVVRSLIAESQRSARVGA